MDRVIQQPRHVECSELPLFRITFFLVDRAVRDQVVRHSLERWDDVMGLIEAHRSLQDRVEEVIDIVKERLGRWAGPKGFVVDADARDSEIVVWPNNWAD